MSIIISLVIFLLVFVIAVKLISSLSTESKVNKKRVAGLVETDESFAQLHKDFGEEQSRMATLAEWFVSGFRKIDSGDGELSLKLYRAGIKSPSAAAYYLFFSSFGWVVGVGIGFLLYSNANSNSEFFWPVLMVAVIIFVLTAFGAKLWVRNATDKRQKVLLRSFPDTLDLLLVCVESGLALDAALARVCKELKFAHPEMTDELNRTRIELTMLNDREKALNNLSRRTDLVAIKSLVAALLQSEKFGTSLTETLRILSDDYRQTRMMIAEEKAGKLASKITVFTLPLMLIALLLLIVSPAGIKVSKVMDENHYNK